MKQTLQEKYDHLVERHKKLGKGFKSCNDQNIAEIVRNEKEIKRLNAEIAELKKGYALDANVENRKLLKKNIAASGHLTEALKHANKAIKALTQ